MGNTQHSNGQDIDNGAVWDIQYVEGKGFSLKNVGTGKYLKNNDTAKYDDPTYFSFCTLGYQPTGISVVTVNGDSQTADTSVYTLQGVKVGDRQDWDALSRGIYIVNGKKLVKR